MQILVTARSRFLSNVCLPRAPSKYKYPPRETRKRRSACWTGYWLEEVAAPYYVFTDAGFEVDLASPQGGKPPCDKNSQVEVHGRKKAGSSGTYSSASHVQQCSAMLQSTCVFGALYYCRHHRSPEANAGHLPCGHTPSDRCSSLQRRGIRRAHVDMAMACRTIGCTAVVSPAKSASVA